MVVIPRASWPYLAQNSIGQILACDCKTDKDIIEAALGADMITTNLLPISARVIKALPGLKAILRRGVGYDAVDVECATECGVMVINIPDFCVEELSNHAIAMMMASAKKLVLLDRLVRNGEWMRAKEAQNPMGAIHDETLGIIGCGRAGLRVAQKARALGMRVLGYDKYAPRDALIMQRVVPSSLDDLLTASDYISLHVGLSDETRHIIGARELSLMRPTATIINTSRGANIDETALIEALKEKRIGAACLDVFENEPLREDSPLTRMDNVILTPHSASYSNTSFRLLRIKAGEEEARVARGERPLHLVNPQVLARLGKS